MTVFYLLFLMAGLHEGIWESQLANYSPLCDARTPPLPFVFVSVWSQICPSGQQGEFQ